MSSYASPSGRNSASPHPSLPARPPPSSNHHVFKPTGSNGAATFFKPRTVGPPPPIVSTAPSPIYGVSQPSYSAGGYQTAPYPGRAQYYQQQPEPFVPATPHIVNPFPLPGQGPHARAGYDPETEAQIAQWQSAYVSNKDDGKATGKSGRGEGLLSAGGANAIPLGGRSGTHTPFEGATVEAGPVLNSADGVAAAKPKTVIRTGGGKTWQDDTLLQWDPNHPRIFVGNLAGEVTDDSLLKAFSKYGSVQKARVVRDNRTNKSKGFGFVSFSNTDDFFNAAKDMNGKYIGSHPVQIKRANTEIKVSAVPDKKQKNGRHGKQGGGRQTTGAGVQKPQQPAQKHKLGPRML
ncbi:uncharacterized protein BDZ99DRAFT_464674, partial [Mytilinidion resinicola]